MIISKGETLLSIRDIKFSGATILEGQKRGENVVEIHYQILAKVMDRAESKIRYTVVKDQVVTFNGEFGDDVFNDALLFVKKFAVQLLNESNYDEKANIGTAIEAIQASQPDSGVPQESSSE